MPTLYSHLRDNPREEALSSLLSAPDKGCHCRKGPASSTISSGCGPRGRLTGWLPFPTTPCPSLPGTSSTPGWLVLISVDSFLHPGQHPDLPHGGAILPVHNLHKEEVQGCTPPTWYRPGTWPSRVSPHGHQGLVLSLMHSLENVLSVPRPWGHWQALNSQRKQQTPGWGSIPDSGGAF